MEVILQDEPPDELGSMGPGPGPFSSDEWRNFRLLLRWPLAFLLVVWGLFLIVAVLPLVVNLAAGTPFFKKSEPRILFLARCAIVSEGLFILVGGTILEELFGNGTFPVESIVLCGSGGILALLGLLAESPHVIAQPQDESSPT